MKNLDFRNVFVIAQKSTTVFGPKRKIMFSVVNYVYIEIEILENLYIMYKIDHADYAALMIYGKNNKLRLCVYFSNVLSDY